jgi:CheY-like chemotaxis protein
MIPVSGGGQAVEQGESNESNDRTPSQQRVVIVDDHTLFREGLKTILATEDDIEVVADLDSAEDIVELVWQTRPDLLLLDIRMPHGSGLDAIPAGAEDQPDDARPGAHRVRREGGARPRVPARGEGASFLKDSARQTLMQANPHRLSRRDVDGPAHVERARRRAARTWVATPTSAACGTRTDSPSASS